MPSVNFDSSPADVRWPVIRGDDSDMAMQFFAFHTSRGDPADVELDVTGNTYISSIATGRDDDRTVVAMPTVVVDDAALGLITVKVTDQQTDLLTNSTYVWDLVENPDTLVEHTLIASRLTVSGRATVGSVFDDGGTGDPIIIDGGGA